MADTQSISISGIEVMKLMASDRYKSHILVQDDVCMGGLVMVLSNSDVIVVQAALETILKLVEWPDLRSHIKNFIGMQEQLERLLCSAPSVVHHLATRIHHTLYRHISESHEDGSGLHRHHSAHSQPHKNAAVDSQTGFVSSDVFSAAAPLKDKGNHQHGDFVASGANKKDQRHRRNSFFVSGVNKSKTIVLQIRGLNDRDDVDLCRSSLLTVKGVISITFDFKHKRAVLRTKPDLRPELLAQSITRTMTMSADQVIKDDDGNEMLVPFSSSAANKENEDMPDYPTVEFSPTHDDNNHVARVGAEHTDDKHSWGFLRSVGSFISNSLYW